MTREWDAHHVFLLWAMWAVMMAGMMLPSAAPLCCCTVRRRDVAPSVATRRADLRARRGIRDDVVVVQHRRGGAQRVLSMLLILSPMMTLTSPILGAAVLLLAGVYQMTPLKSVCLRQCQSPMSFLMHHWRPGSAAPSAWVSITAPIASDAAGRSWCCCSSAA